MPSRKPAAPAPHLTRTESTTEDDLLTLPEYQVSPVKVVLVGGLVFMFLILFLVGVGLGLYSFLKPAATPDKGPAKRDKVDAALYESISNALSAEGVDAEHALYLGRVFAGVRDRLMVDAENKAPIFDQTGEVVALVQNLGTLATKGNEMEGAYPELPAVLLTELLENQLGKDPEDGPLTTKQLTAFASRCGDFAAAFDKLYQTNK